MPPSTLGTVATILVVDDHPTTRYLLRSVLQTEGHTVLEAPNGRSALAELSHHPEIALLVTDLEMPVMGGLELLRALVARPELPKLVVSSCTAPPLTGLGVAELFRKPPDLARFKVTVTQLVGAPAVTM